MRLSFPFQIPRTAAANAITNAISLMPSQCHCCRHQCQCCTFQVFSFFFFFFLSSFFQCVLTWTGRSQVDAHGGRGSNTFTPTSSLQQCVWQQHPYPHLACAAVVGAAAPPPQPCGSNSSGSGTPTPPSMCGGSSISTSLASSCSSTCGRVAFIII